MKRFALTLAVLVAGTGLAGTFRGAGAYAHWEDEVLTLGNGLFTAVYEADGDLLRTRSLALKDDTPIVTTMAITNAPTEMKVACRVARKSPVGAEALCVEVVLGCKRTELTVFASVPGVVVERHWQDDVAPSVSPRDYRRWISDGWGTGESLGRMSDELRFEAPTAEVCEYQVLDQTDVRDTVVTRSSLITPTAELPRRVTATMLDVRERISRRGVALLKLAPMPSSRTNDLPDFFVDGNRRPLKVTVLANGYPVVALAYRGDEAGRIEALCRLQRAYRSPVVGRDGLFLSNTWGGGNRDSRINEEFLRREIEAGAELGVEVIQVDDGWQKGRTQNSADCDGRGNGAWGSYWGRDADFWRPDAERFPAGLRPLVELARAKGMRFGLWYGPDSSDDAAQWERDAACLLDFYRTLGIDHFKLDSLSLHSRTAFERNRRMFDRLLEATGGKMVFDLDATAQIRPGYFGLMDVGPVFVENRYAGGHYSPWKTLSSLWQLTHVVDPVRLRFEVVNPEPKLGEVDRSTPYSIEKWPMDAPFAVAMCASPLAWMELSEISSARREAMKKLVRRWKCERPMLHGGITFPVGEKPDGFSWTGFVTRNESARVGYVLLFREASEVPRWRLELGDWLADGAKSAEIIGGRGEAKIEQGVLTVTVPAKNDFIWVKLAMPEKDVVLERGKTGIVISPDAPKTVEFAATELAELLGMCFEKKIPVFRGASIARNVASRIFVGNGEWLQKGGVDVDSLDRDEYVIKATGEDVYLVGRDDLRVDTREGIERGGIWNQYHEHATAFAVYGFLEKYAGARFYFPGELGTIVPRANSIRVPRGKCSYRPEFSQRMYSVLWDGPCPGSTNAAAKCQPEKALAWTRLKMQTHYVPCCHGLNQFNFLKRFGKEHPEYFRLSDQGVRVTSANVPFAGQVCHSSGIWDKIFEDVRAYGEGADAAKHGMGIADWHVQSFRFPYVDVMSQDGMEPCFCEGCQKAYGTGANYATELIWGRTAELARRLKAVDSPVILTQMAYWPYRQVPKVDLPNNIRVMVAERGPWSVVDAKEFAREVREIRAWRAKLGRKPWTWNYVCKFGNKRVPQFAPRAWGRYYRKIGDDVFGAFAESESDRWFYNHLNYVVASRVFQDTRTDVDAVLAEYCRLMFGAAEREMSGFIDLLEEKWTMEIAGRTVDTALGPKQIMPSKGEMAARIYSPGVLTRLGRILDEATEKVEAGSLEARRIDLYRQEILVPLAEAMRAEGDRVKKVNACRIEAGRGRYIHLAKTIGHSSESGRSDVETKVEIWRGEGMLHAVYDCEEPEMEDVVTKKRGLDELECWQDNSVELLLNPSGDRRVYYHLVLTSAGCFFDERCERMGAENAPSDQTWNSGASTKVTRTGCGWRAQIDVPLTALGACNTDFPANFGRNRTLKTGTTYLLPNLLAENYHDIENFATLTQLGSGDEVIGRGTASGDTVNR